MDGVAKSESSALSIGRTCFRTSSFLITGAADRDVQKHGPSEPPRRRWSRDNPRILPRFAERSVYSSRATLTATYLVSGKTNFRNSNSTRKSSKLRNKCSAISWASVSMSLS